MAITTIKTLLLYVLPDFIILITTLMSVNPDSVVN